MKTTKRKFTGTDEDRYYTFAPTQAEAQAIADEANRSGETRGGWFVAGSFKVEMLRGLQPVVTGELGKGAK